MVSKTNKKIIETCTSMVTKNKELLISSTMGKIDKENSLNTMISKTSKCTMAITEVATRTGSTATSGMAKKTLGNPSNGIISSMSLASSLATLPLTSTMFSQLQPSFLDRKTTSNTSRSLSPPLKLTMTQLRTTHSRFLKSPKSRLSSHKTQAMLSITRQTHSLPPRLHRLGKSQRTTCSKRR